MGQVSLGCLGQINVPIGPTKLKWGGTTLLVATFVLALFAIGGYLAANNMLPGGLAWMDAGTIGNAMLLTATAVAFVLGVGTWILSRQKQESPKDTDAGGDHFDFNGSGYQPDFNGRPGYLGHKYYPYQNQGTPSCHTNFARIPTAQKEPVPSVESKLLATERSEVDSSQPLYTFSQAVQKTPINKNPIYGWVRMQYPDPDGSNWGILGSPKKGESQQDFYKAVDYLTGGSARRKDGREWRNDPKTPMVQCHVSAGSTLPPHVIWLPLFLFEGKQEGAFVEFIFNNRLYALQIAHQDIEQQTLYYRTNFAETYQSILRSLAAENAQPVLAAHPYSYKEWCEDKPFFGGFNIQNPSVPKYQTYQLENHFIIKFQYDFASHVQFINDGKYLAIHATEPPSQFHPPQSEYLIVLSLLQGTTQENVRVENDTNGCGEITITPPAGKMNAWFDHFSKQMENLWKRWGEKA